MSTQTLPETNFGTSPNPRTADKSIGELFADLSRETSQLVRQEVQLAKTEVTTKAAKAGKDVGMVAGGAALAGVGFLVLSAALVCGLAALTHSVGLSALIVAVVYLLAGALVAMQGVAGLKRLDLKPEATVETLKEDGQWLKNIQQ